VASLAERILGRTAGEDILVPGTDEVIVGKGELIDERKADAVESAGVQTCDPLAADLRGRGRRLRHLLRARPRPRHQGEHRRGRRHHRGAVHRRTRHAADDADLPHRRRRAGWSAVLPGGQRRGKIAFANPNLLKNAAGEQIVMGRNMSMVINDDQGEERASFKLGYGTKVMVEDGQR
jgi:DNA-directed RNA polymerase subunit beta'